MLEAFSVNEAAAIAEVSPDTIRTALEKKSMAPSFKRKTGNAVRYEFSVGDVLFVKVLVEFPFPLSKEDKQSLAKILPRGDRRAARWSREGSDLVYRSGDMQVSVECKSFGRPWLEIWRPIGGAGVVLSSPEILSGEPVFRGTRVPFQHVASLYRKGASERDGRRFSGSQ